MLIFEALISLRGHGLLEKKEQYCTVCKSSNACITGCYIVVLENICGKNPGKSYLKITHTNILILWYIIHRSHNFIIDKKYSFFWCTNSSKIQKIFKIHVSK